MLVGQDGIYYFRFITTIILGLHDQEAKLSFMDNSHDTIDIRGFFLTVEQRSRTPWWNKGLH